MSNNLRILTAAHLMLLGHGKYLVTPQPMAVGHPNLTRCESILSFFHFKSPHLLSCFPAHCIQTAITLLTSHLTQVQVV